MTLSAGQQAELEKAVTRFAYFAEFQFLTQTVRVTSLNQTVNWGGYDWIGLGSLGNIGQITEKDGAVAVALSFTLNLAQQEWITLSIVDPTEYRGRDAKLYFCPLDEQFRLVGTPVRRWQGTMDVMATTIDGEQGAATGKVQLKCETSAYGLRRRSALRLSPAQHKLKNPSDTGLDYLVELVTNPDANIWYKK